MCLKKIVAIVVQEYVAQALHISVHLVKDKDFTKYLKKIIIDRN